MLTIHTDFDALSRRRFLCVGALGLDELSPLLAPRQPGHDALHAGASTPILPTHFDAGQFRRQTSPRPELVRRVEGGEPIREQM